MTHDPTLESVARRVAIVAMGSSCADWIRLCAGSGGYPAVVDEVWAINAMGGVILHDRLFAMDDVRIQERRVAAMEAGEYQTNQPVFGTMQWLKSHPGPVYTSRSHSNYPGSFDIPAQEICRAADTAYFNSTVAWAIGYAMLMRQRFGVLEQLHLFGVDFSYANSPHKAEAGRACVEFLLGRLIERGVKLVLPQTTTLFDTLEPITKRLYGFDTEKLEIKPSPDGLVLTRTELAEADWPGAAEIEKRYRPTVDLKPKPVAGAGPRLVEQPNPTKGIA